MEGEVRKIPVLLLGSFAVWGQGCEGGGLREEPVLQRAGGGG